MSVQVPFITGGAEALAATLQAELQRRGCEVETVLIPFKWYPPGRLLDSMMVARLVDLEEVNGRKIDRMIALKFPAYFAPHPGKVCWILHQHRQAYDLYGTPQSDLAQTDEGRAVAAEIKRWDEYFLPQSRGLYTISNTVAARLRKYNQLEASTLYPPPASQNKFYCGRWDNYILCPGRVDAMKRQHLPVEALPTIPPHIQLVFCGQSNSDYAEKLLKKVQASPDNFRVKFLGRVSEEEKIELYANCLAVYNGVYDEDYGYVTVEAFLAGKPVITHTDSGGPLEFVINGQNGWITEPEPAALGQTIGALAEDVNRVKELGKKAKASLASHNISWDYVIERLLS